MKSKLITAKQAATKLHLHYDTILGYIREKAPAKKVIVQGRKKVWMIDFPKLKRWIKNN